MTSHYLWYHDNAVLTKCMCVCIQLPFFAQHGCLYGLSFITKYIFNSVTYESINTFIVKSQLHSTTHLRTDVKVSTALFIKVLSNVNLCDQIPKYKVHYT